MNLKKILKKADELIKANNLVAAKQLLLKIFDKNNNDIDILNKLAYISFRFNEVEEAKKYLEKLLILAPDRFIEANLLTLYLRSKDWLSAKKIIKQILDTDPNNYEIIKNSAYVEGKLENFEVSSNLYKNLIKDHENDLDLYINYGYLLNLQEKYSDAIEVYKAGLGIENTNYHLLYNIGVTCKNLNSFEESINYFKQAIAVKDTDYKVWLTMAGSMMEIGQMDNAYEAICMAGKINSINPEILYQQSIFKQKKGLYDESISLLKKALEIDKNHIESNIQLGLMYLKLGRYSESREHRKYRVFKKNRYVDDFAVTTLKNNQKVLAVWEEGIGDTLLYMRLVREMMKWVNSLEIVVQDKLYFYLKRNYPEIIFIKDSDIEKIKADRKYISYTKINLGSVLRYVEEPNKKSFLEKKHYFDQKIVDKYRKDKFIIKNEKKIIGLSWKSNNLENYKSFNLDILDNFFKNNDFYIVNLQYGDISLELKKIEKNYKRKMYLDNNLDYFENINGLANLIASCDVVITCSNITAHIAGALHVKTYLLVPKEVGALWYWYQDEKNSSWYPSIEIIKQKKDGDWSSVAELINKIL